MYKINKPNETSKQQDQNQSIDEDNFNNQSNESEQLEQNEELNNLMKHQMKMLKTLKVPKRMIVTDSPLILVKTHISYLLKIELKSSMTIVKEKHAKSTQFDHLSPQERKEQLRIQRRKRQKEFSTLSLHFSIINNFIFTLHVYTTK